MSAYNTLRAVVRCPRCSSEAEMEIEFKFGLLDFRDYRLGEQIDWGNRGLRSPASRPKDGNFCGDGYVECPVCGKDFWVDICVQHDLIERVDVDPTRPGYIS